MFEMAVRSLSPFVIHDLMDVNSSFLRNRDAVHRTIHKDLNERRGTILRLGKTTLLEMEVSGKRCVHGPNHSQPIINQKN